MLLKLLKLLVLWVANSALTTCVLLAFYILNHQHVLDGTKAFIAFTLLMGLFYTNLNKDGIN